MRVRLLILLSALACTAEQAPDLPQDVNALPDQTIEFRVARLGANDDSAALATEWSQNDDVDSIAIEIFAGYHARLNTYAVDAFVRRIDPADIAVDTTGRWIAVRVTHVSDTAFEARVRRQQAFLRPSQFREVLAEPLGVDEHVTRLRVTSTSIRGGVAERSLTLLWPGI